MSQLTEVVSAKSEIEMKLTEQVRALKATVERLSGEMQDFKGLNMSVNTQATTGTEYIPIRVSKNVPGGVLIIMAYFFTFILICYQNFNPGASERNSYGTYASR